MHDTHHYAGELRDGIAIFCQHLRAESAAILQACAAFEKLQGYLAAIASHSGTPTASHAAKQRHTIEMAMLRTVVCIDEIFAARDAAALAYRAMDPAATGFAAQYLGVDLTSDDEHADS